MAKQQLNLLKLATRGAAELCRRAAAIVLHDADTNAKLTPTE
ncbi:MAG: hypothetical protein ABSG25_04220 [Bryobacteraceae bacterium]